METNNTADVDNRESEEECMKRLDNATKEWDAVQEIVPSFATEMRSSLLQNNLHRSVKDSPLVSVDQVIQDFKNQDLTIQKKEAQVRQ